MTRNVCREREREREREKEKGISDANAWQILIFLIIVTDLRDENPTVIDVRVTSAEFDIPATRVSLVTTRHTLFSYSCTIALLVRSMISGSNGKSSTK